MKRTGAEVCSDLCCKRGQVRAHHTDDLTVPIEETSYSGRDVPSIVLRADSRTADVGRVLRRAVIGERIQLVDKSAARSVVRLGG